MEKKKAPKWFVILFPFLVIGIIGGCAKMCHSVLNKERSTDPKDYLSDARWECQSQIKASLKDPESAKFDDAKAIYKQTTKKGEHIYEMVTEVSATNSFGGRVRSVFDCEVRSMDFKAWKVIRTKPLSP